MARFGLITTKYMLNTDCNTTQKVANNKGYKQQDVRMTANGSIMKTSTQPKASSQSETKSIADIADAINILNQTLNTIDKSKNVSTAKSNSSNATSGSEQGASGISQGVSGAESYGNAPSMQRLSNVSTNLGNFDYAELKEAIQNDINPIVQDINSNFNAAKADYNVLLGQKDQAEADVSNLKTEIQSAQSEKNEAQKSLDSSESNLNSSIQARDKMDEQLAELNGEYKEICSDVKAKENEKKQCQTKVSECKSNVTSAESGLNAATASYDSAKANLDSTPETLPDGTPNPQYPAAQAACENALKAKEEAQKTLDKAKSELEKAQQDFSKASENLTSAQNVKKEKLTDIKNTDSKYKNLAEACEKNEQQVENAQKSYDSSVETFDNTNANYERLNLELQSAQGILTQCDEYESKIQDLETSANKANEIKAKAQQALLSKNSDLANEALADAKELKREEIKKEIAEYSAKSEGCSAYKTPAENLLSMKNGPYDIHDKGDWVQTSVGVMETNKSFGVSIHNDVINADNSYFEEIGCIPNSDGSYTNPSNGETYVRVNDDTWVNTMSLGKMDAKYGDAVDPEIRKAGIRAKEQGDVGDLLKLDKKTGRVVLS